MKFKRQIICILSLVVIGVAFLRVNSFAEELPKTVLAYNLIGTWDAVGNEICNDISVPERFNFLMEVTNQWGNLIDGYILDIDEPGPVPIYFTGAILGKKIKITFDGSDPDGNMVEIDAIIKNRGAKMVGLWSDNWDSAFDCPTGHCFCTGRVVATKR